MELVSKSRRLPVLVLSPSTAPQPATMVRISVLNDCLRNMVNAEKRGKRQVLIKPSSKVVVKFLQCMMKHGKQQQDAREKEQ